MMERTSHHAERTPNMNRRSFVHLNILGMMAASSTTVVGLLKAIAISPLPEKEKVRHSRELCAMIQKQLNIPYVCEKSPKEADAKADSAEMQLSSMAQDASQRTLQLLCGLFSQPSKQSHEISSSFQSAMHWTNTYGASTNCNLCETEIDCNDYGHRACEVWHNAGYQGYLVNMWPVEVYDRLDEDWHQIGVLRVGEQKYIIVNNRSITIWHGTFESYMSEYQQEAQIPSSIIPIFGIAQYAKPVNDYPLVKLTLTMALHQGSDEHAMQIQPVTDLVD